MAHDTHGVLPQDMALFHLFQDIRRNTDRNAVIGRFRYAFLREFRRAIRQDTPRLPLLPCGISTISFAVAAA